MHPAKSKSAARPAGLWRQLRRFIGVEQPLPPPHIASDAQARAVRHALQTLLERDEDCFRQVFLDGAFFMPDAFERPLLKVLESAGYVMTTRAGAVRACVRVFFLDDLLIATDRLAHDDEDQVFSLMDEQVFLVRSMDVRKGDHVLEIFLGSGVNALAAARRGAARVVGVDINPRAIAFATANAAVNLSPQRGDARLETLHGSLFDPLASDERFDLILANPPFELVPPNTSYFLHSHGGEDGLDIVREFLPGIANRLKPGGRFEMVTWTPGDPTSEWVGGLVAEALPGFRVELRRFDALPLDGRIATFNANPHYAAWRERLISRGISHVYGVHVRALREGMPGLVSIDAIEEIRACDPILARWR